MEILYRWPNTQKSWSYINLSWVTYCENMLTFPLYTDNMGDLLYLKNGSFKSEVGPHQFNLKLHHFSQFPFKVKKKNSDSLHNGPAMRKMCPHHKVFMYSSSQYYASEPENQLRRMSVHPDSKVHGDNMGPTWVLSTPDGPHVGPMNLAIRAV